MNTFNQAIKPADIMMEMLLQYELKHFERLISFDPFLSDLTFTPVACTTLQLALHRIGRSH